jgi:N-acetyl-gamma-glutamyl-phosphate reductase
MEKRVKVAVVGASGYSGEELVGLILRHPFADLVCVTSRAEAGRRLDEVFPRFRDARRAPVVFVAPEVSTILASEAKFVFLALPHGLAAEFAAPLIAAGVRVIDLSADFRLRDTSVYQEFYGHVHPAPSLLGGAVYGLPELHRAAITSAQLVAAPGCYPTSILVPLVPLLREGLIDPAQILVSSMSGVSGAGRKVEVALLFSELNESAKAYASPKHRHLSEIEQELSLAAGAPVVISFTPHLIPITRGILSTIYLTLTGGVGPAAIGAAWAKAYATEPFVRILAGKEQLPEIRHVVNTNFIDLAWRHDPRTGRVIVFSAEDNLVKGASGQAVQCFNLMAGFPETAGF